MTPEPVAVVHGVITAAIPGIDPHIAYLISGSFLPLVLACIAGSYASFSFGESVQPRSRMFGLWIACVIMGWAFTSVLNAVIVYMLKDFGLTMGVQAAVGAIISCMTRFIIPAMIERVGPWMDKIPFLKKKDE